MQINFKILNNKIKHHTVTPLTGLLWMECKAMYNSGIRVYLLDNYNWIDFIVLSVYLSSYVLRFFVDHKIKKADQHYRGMALARTALLVRNETEYDRIKEEIFKDVRMPELSYFMKACKLCVRFYFFYYLFLFLDKMFFKSLFFGFATRNKRDTNGIHN